MAKKELADYQAKRGFQENVRASGNAKIRAPEYPLVVIQNHAALPCTTICASISMNLRAACSPLSPILGHKVLHANITGPETVGDARPPLSSPRIQQSSGRSSNAHCPDQSPN